MYSLNLNDLIVPEPLRNGIVHAQRVGPEHLELVVSWLVDFALESLGEIDNPQ
ncbi:unnamed protein product, partial [marine sediment metagenome]